MDLNDLQAKIHKTAVEHGWWEPQHVKTDLGHDAYIDRSFGELCALVHSEVSEAVEAYRERGLEEWEEFAPGSNGLYSKPEGAFTELGDAIIRILDMAAFYGVDMQEIIERKMAFNETRSYRHGGKKI